MRLTQKDDQGNWSLRGVKWEQLHVGQIITQEVSEKLYGALWKLMEYEDTGLTPEEIVDGKMLTGWIPVAEQLPEAKEDVLVCTRDGWILTAWYGPHGESWHITPTDLNHPMKDINAWMPLPEPYRPDN
ncbi:Uncharacterised protein [uncultured Clostridium sp.]|mgnify:CR=1 FL=1|nr:Uncharacterised protein [uncultured Clostridium sp.]DAF33011.1 MAG TPA: Protein of unknown function (DUF551) [Caudoviricetes sp.]